jgi:hypothetical protein
MYVNRIGASRVVTANGPVSGDVHHPDWNTIERTIREMDGKRCFCTELHHATPEWEGRELTDEAAFELLPHMAITGYDDHFLVFVSRPGQAHIHILKTDYSQEEDDWYASLESTSQAARTFAMTGEVDESLVWKVQPTQ